MLDTEEKKETKQSRYAEGMHLCKVAFITLFGFSYISASDDLWPLFKVGEY